MTLMSIVIEATALVLSGKLDQIEDKEKTTPGDATTEDGKEVPQHQ